MRTSTFVKFVAFSGFLLLVGNLVVVGKRDVRMRRAERDLQQLLESEQMAQKDKHVASVRDKEQ